MRKVVLLVYLFILASNLSAASLNENLIEIRDDLFNSQDELSSFTFKDRLNNDESSYFSNVDMYLLTGGAGSLLWEDFGHSAFIARLPDGREISFDYGIFEFGNGFYKNFVLGRLYYSIMVSYSHYRINSLISDDRTVELLQLNLDNKQKYNLISFLEYNAREENRTYLYNYYSDNCATRLRDAYNAITEDSFRMWAEKQESNETLRDYSKRYMSRSTFLVDWAINYLLGPSVDSKITLWEAMFLPDVLNTAISQYQGNSSEIIYESQNRKATPASYSFFLYSIILIAIMLIPIVSLLSRKRNIRRACDLLISCIYMVLGAMAIVLLFFMSASIHDATYRNENILILSPALLVLAILHMVALGRKEKRKGIKNLSLILLLVTVLMLILKLLFPNVFAEDNIEYYITALFIYSGEFIMNRHLIRRNKCHDNLS